MASCFLSNGYISSVSYIDKVGSVYCNGWNLGVITQTQIDRFLQRSQDWVIEKKIEGTKKNDSKLLSVGKETLKNASLPLHCPTHTHMIFWIFTKLSNTYVNFVLLPLLENSAWVWFLVISKKMPDFKYLSQVKFVYLSS